jgi:hypothetical protein
LKEEIVNFKFKLYLVAFRFFGDVSRTIYNKPDLFQKVQERTDRFNTNLRRKVWGVSKVINLSMCLRKQKEKNQIITLTPFEID